MARRVVTGGLILMALLFGLISAAALYLDSAAGHRRLIAWLEEETAGGTAALEISGLSGSLFGKLRIDRVTVSDPRGNWAEIKDVTLQWRPFSLLRRRLAVSRLAAAAVRLHRLPASGETAAAAPAALTVPELSVDLVVDDFRLGDIDLGRLLPGEARLSNTGRLNLLRGQDLDLSFLLGRRDGTGDRLSLEVAYQEDRRRLRLDGLLKAPRGGLFGRLLGRDDLPGLEVRLMGAGPLERWTGTLAVRSGETPLGQADIVHDNGRFALTSGFDLTRFLEPDLAHRIGGRLDLNLDIRRREAAAGHLLDLRLETDLLAFRLLGPVRPGDLSLLNDLEVGLELRQPLMLEASTAPLLLHPARLSGRLSGRLEAPRLNVTLPALRLQRGAGLDLTTSVAGDLEIAGDRLSGRLEGAVTQLRGKDLAAVAPLAGGRTDWRLAGEYVPQSTRLSVAELRLTGEKASLAGAGDMALSGGAADASFTLRLSDLAALVPGGGGVLGAEIRLRRESADRPLRIALEAETERLDLNEAWLNGLTGPELRLSARLNLVPDGIMTLETASLAGRHVTAEAAATLSGAARSLTGTYRLALRDLERMALPPSLRFKGGFEMSGTLAGTAAAPGLTLRADLDALDLQGVALTEVQIGAEAQELLTAPRLRLELSGRSDLGPLSARVRLETEPDGARQIPELTARLGPLRAVGRFELPDGGGLTGRLRLQASSGAEEGGAPSRLTVAGLDMQAVFSAADKDQKIESSGRLSGLRYVLPGGDLLQLNEGQFEGEVVFAVAGPAVTMTGRLDRLSHPRLELSRLDLAATHRGDVTDYELRARGTPTLPLDLELKGELAPAADGRRLSVALSGSLNARPLNSREPLVLVLGRNSTLLEPAELRFGAGRLTAAFSAGEQKLSARLAAENLDLRPLGRFFPALPVTGLVNGELRLLATPESRDGEFSLRLAELTSPYNLFAVDPALQMSLTGRLLDREIQLDGRLELAEVFAAGISGRLPARFDVAGRRLDIPDDRPLRGKISVKGDVGAIWPVFNLYHHDLSGQMDGHFDLSGSLDEPVVSGRLEMTDGRYENTQIGFVAQQIALAASVDRGRLVLESLTATDGAEGRITAGGDVRILEDYDFDLALDLKAGNSWILHQPTLDIRASADLSLRKKGRDFRLEGDISVDRGNISLVDRGDSEIIEADVIEINGDDASGQRNGAAQRRLGPLLLDLRLKAPQRVFIRGRGLDSEWRGALDITGTSDRPVLDGSISLERGFFDFSGKRFTLTRGEIDFPGDISNDPRLDIATELRLSGLEARLHIGGRASRPDLTVTSSPALPQEEILARILFGTSAAELSALEALQLASSLQVLSGDGGPGVVDQLRGGIGIDRLAINAPAADSDRDYGTTISGGKYLTNNIYMEVTTSPTTGATAQSVEVELSDNLSLITRRSLDRENSLAIRWSWDY